MRNVLHRVSVALLLVAMCLSVCGGDELSKLSPFVRKAAVEASAHDVRHMSRSKERMLCAFVRADGEPGERAIVANRGQILDRKGDIYIVAMPLSAIRPLACESCVSRIEAGRRCALTMDTTATIIGASRAYAAESLPQAYTGRGVVVGVMDVGFDLTHPTFYDSTATHYRIGAFWDQLTTDTIGSLMPVGRDYVTPETVLAVERSFDGLEQTHGTHTLGIAAGSGFNTAYRGIAWESDICAVSNAVGEDLPLIAEEDLYKYTTATDALGFKYIFDHASKLGQPCVASFSEGYRMGMDGEDSLYCAYLSQLTGPGRIIVASAGNEARYYTYMAKPADAERVGTYIFSISQSATMLLEANGEPDVVFLSYGAAVADTLRIATAHCLPDTTTTFSFINSVGDSLFQVDVSRYRSAFMAEDNMFCITVEGSVPLSEMASVAVAIEGKGIDAALSVHSSDFTFLNGGDGSPWNGAETSHNVFAPGCFPDVVTVGSTIHRTGFRNYEGLYKDYSQQGRNDGVRSNYSSVGPGLYGSVKPDVMAPGDNIVSSYSSFYIANNPTASDIGSDVAHFDFNGRTYAWNSNTGTSMATPVAAGVIALWLQACPTLSPDDVRGIIQHTSRQPDTALQYPNNLYGYGEINAYSGLLYLLGLDGIDKLSAEPLRGVSVEVLPSKTLRLRFASPYDDGVNVKVYSVGGRQEVSMDVGGAGQTEATVPLAWLADGVYAVQVTDKGNRPLGSTLVRIENR